MKNRQLQFTIAKIFTSKFDDFSAKNSNKFVYYNEELVHKFKFQTQLSRKLQRFRTCRTNKKCSIFHNLSEYIICSYVCKWTGPLTEASRTITSLKSPGGNCRTSVSRPIELRGQLFKRRNCNFSTYPFYETNMCIGYVWVVVNFDQSLPNSFWINKVIFIIWLEFWLNLIISNRGILDGCSFCIGQFCRTFMKHFMIQYVKLYN